jgi:hypothetical protein
MSLKGGITFDEWWDKYPFRSSDMIGPRWDSAPRAAWEASALNSAGLAAKYLALLERIEPHIDSIVCYASTMGEYEPNRIAYDLHILLGRSGK